MIRSKLVTNKKTDQAVISGGHSERLKLGAGASHCAPKPTSESFALNDTRMWYKYRYIHTYKYRYRHTYKYRHTHTHRYSCTHRYQKHWLKTSINQDAAQPCLKAIQQTASRSNGIFHFVMNIEYARCVGRIQEQCPRRRQWWQKPAEVGFVFQSHRNTWSMNKSPK